MKARTWMIVGASALALGVTTMAHAMEPQAEKATASSLLAQFQDPPNSARPRVWWQWLNGNVTKEGLRKDLEWMSRVGVGGVQTFEIQLLSPKVVDKQLVHLTPEWKEAFRYATELADRSGLELTVAGSQGWSETGAPWVAPKDAMKKLVWSETILQAGHGFSGRLTPLPAVTGPYQDMPKPAGMSDMAGVVLPTYGGDAAVIAVRLPTAPPLPAAMVSNAKGETLDGATLVDGDFGSGVSAPRGADKAAILNLTFDTPQTVRSASVYVPSAAPAFGAITLQATLEVEAAQGWRPIAEVALSAVPSTVSFAPTVGRAFRLVLKPTSGADAVSALSAPAPGAINILPPATLSKTVKVTQLQLSGESRVNQFELKGGFAIAQDYYGLDAGVGPEVAGVAAASVIDLTDRVGPDGRLDWTPPTRGSWTILRFGYSLVGATNHPAMPQSTGLEVDKFDGDAVRRYMQTNLDNYADTTGPDLIGRRGLQAIINDSTEVGPSNWTPAMLGQFQRLRGYDPRPYLPALAGVVVESRKASDAFLYDFRRTLADLHASEHYGQIAAVAHERGLKVYGEALEDHRPVLGDDMAMRSHTDIPMAAFWTYSAEQGARATYLADVKGAASVAHVYGQNLVAAEALTSATAPWAYSPAQLKVFVDQAFSLGVNRPVISASCTSPWKSCRACRCSSSASTSTAMTPGPSSPNRGPTIWRAPATCCSRVGTSPTSPISMAKRGR